MHQGGTCNADWLHWAPHCHGTHTECVGHVVSDPVHVLDTIDTRPGFAALVTVEPEESGIIGLTEIQQALMDCDPGLQLMDAVVIRTLPNPSEKQFRNYQETPGYPVLSASAIAWLAASPISHLLIDTPSLDAASNEILANHRTWWGLDDANPDPDGRSFHRSITEMIYVPDDLADGLYWLHLELSPLRLDATPSRPILYPVSPV